jgi:feruloyl esterase
MYTPIVLPSTGRPVLPALLQPGSELGWSRLGGAEPLVNAVEPFKYVVFKNANWDYHAFRLASDLPLAIRADEGVIDRTDPNLRPFFDAGGKLLMYHGWSDPQVPALDTVDYFDAVLKATGEARRGTAIELYMEPGVSHCFGGDGPDTFDAVGALDTWERSGHAPSHIVAARLSTDGEVVRTRPLCPYPEIARYVGSGSIDDAASFRCTADTASPASAAHRHAMR